MPHGEQPEGLQQNGHTNKKHVKPEDGFPTYQLTILAICRFSEPIAFNSILAYTYIMVQDLNGTDVNASFYAGLLVSAYAVAEALTSMLWGAVSDRYGRKPVVLFGLCGVAISSLIFGLAKTYWVALLARFVGGSLNGNVSVMQTMVAEMVKKPEHEPRAYAVQPFVWFAGSILGSAMGGYLAQPAKFYPDIFPEDGLFGQYPYLLPNLVSVAVIVIAVIQGIIFLDETNPQFANNSLGQSLGTHVEQDEEFTPLIRETSQPRSVMEDICHGNRPFTAEEGLPTASDQRFDLRHNSFGTMHSIQVRPDIKDLQQGTSHGRAPVNGQETAFNFAVIMLILALVIAAFHQMAFGAILPIYLLDSPSYNSTTARSPKLDLSGGMGFSLHDVGGFLAVNGFIALFIQGVIFPLFVESTGVWLSFLVPTILYPICYVMMPFLSLLRPVGQIEGEPDSPVLSAGIYVTLCLQNFFGIIVTPCALILLKNACPSPLVLGRVNGLAMSAVCIARTISSPLVGVFYDAGGSAAAWGGCAVVAIIGAIQLWWVPKDKVVGSGPEKVEVHVESAFVGHQEHDANGSGVGVFDDNDDDGNDNDEEDRRI
jgi:MFS family permease